MLLIWTRSVQVREGWAGGAGEVSRLGPAQRCQLVPRVQFSSHPEHMNSGGRPAWPAVSASRHSADTGTGATDRTTQNMGILKRNHNSIELKSNTWIKYTCISRKIACRSLNSVLFNLCFLGGGVLIVPRRDSLQSQWAEQIVDYLSGAAGPGPWVPGLRAGQGRGPGRDRRVTLSSPQPGLASPLRNMIYDSSLVPGRPMWAAHNLDPANPGEEGGCDSTPATAGTMNFVRFVKRKFHILHRGLTESQQLTGGWLWQLQRLS